MAEEHYYDPVEKLTDPFVLITKQYQRKVNCDSPTTFSWLFSIVAPFIFAFIYKDFWQILKLIYIPVSVFSAGHFFNALVGPLAPRSFWLRFCAIEYWLLMISPLMAIAIYLPDPIWYQAIIPFTYLMFWVANRWIPQKEKEDWRIFCEHNNCTKEEAMEIVNAKLEGDE
tara:strand:- start:200 stop:709 length:510 start_codon:yes stop_codon:yes gene_type:complete